MIAPDANLLIYAISPGSKFHTKSRTWLEGILSGTEPVGIPFLSVHAFLRFVTDSKLVPKPLRFHEAAAIVDSWLSLQHVRILYPGDRHWQLFQDLASEARLTGGNLTDAAIAAIAQEHGATIHSHDRDFARFPNLRWHNPLQT